MKHGLALIAAISMAAAFVPFAAALDYSYEEGQEHDYPWVKAQAITEKWIDMNLSGTQGIYLYNFSSKTLDHFSKRTVMPFRLAKTYIPPDKFYLRKYKELLPKASSQMVVLIELQDAFDQSPDRLPKNDLYALPRN